MMTERDIIVRDATIKEDEKYYSKVSRCFAGGVVLSGTGVALASDFGQVAVVAGALSVLFCVGMAMEYNGLAI